MKLTKTLSAILLLAVLALSATACGNTPSGPELSAPSSAVSETQAASNVAQTDDFDFDEVCKNVVINGKQYTFPFTFEELGDGYNLENITYLKLTEDDEYYTAVCSLNYHGVKINNVHYFGVTEEEKGKYDLLYSKPIDNITQLSADANNSRIYVEICGVKVGSPYSDCDKYIGTPYSIKYDDNNIPVCYTYYGDTENNKCIELTFRDEKVSSVGIRCKKTQ